MSSRSASPSKRRSKQKRGTTTGPRQQPTPTSPQQQQPRQITHSTRIEQRSAQEKRVPKKEIELADVRFAVFDRDLNQPADSDQKSVNFGDKLPTKFALDGQKKLRLSFVVKDKQSKSPIVVHQSFFLLSHAQKGNEIIFVAEPDKISKIYTVDLDMKVHGNDFGGTGGAYTARLVLGDAAVANPIDWLLCDLSLSVPQVPVAKMPKSAQVNYNILPEIHHTFRSPEPRPPVILSDTFAFICAAPLLLMFILWLRIGLNFGNIKCSLFALGFHIGLCAIFGLYTFYWLKLDMFQTLQWLAVIGLATLACGNRLLHSFRVSKKSKSE